MLHGVEVTRLDHGVELPDRAQRGVRRGREVDAVNYSVEPCGRWNVKASKLPRMARRHPRPRMRETFAS